MIVEPAHEPAVAAIGVDESLAVLGAEAEALQQGADIDATGRCLVERGDGFAQAGAGCGAYGRVLPPQQFLCFRGERYSKENLADAICAICASPEQARTRICRGCPYLPWPCAPGVPFETILANMQRELGYTTGVR